MVNYFVCPCLFDTISAINHNDIDELMKFLSVNYLIIECDRTFYIACKDSMDFYSEYILKRIVILLLTQMNQLVVCYGFEDACSLCEKIILDFFADHLCKIEK